MNVKKGDYVLATKYHDGNPNDHWAVGFYDGPSYERHMVLDDNGQPFRASGFRRVKKITAQRGAWLLQNKHDIEFSGRSLWQWARASITP